MNETKQTELRVRPRRTELAASKPDIEWVKNAEKKHWQERLLPNLAIASALMLCAVALKNRGDSAADGCCAVGHERRDG